MWAPNRCTKDGGDNDDGADEAPPTSSSDANVEGIFDYLPGHVFFFDRWDDAKKETFWAYESTLKDEQTQACLTKGAAFCFNHHVKKKSKELAKFARANCTSTQYGWVSGGPHRLSSALVCSS